MSGTVQGTYKELNLVENLTADGDYPANEYLTLKGDWDIAIIGTFDTAQIEFVFFTENSAGTLVERPVSTDFTFTAAPEPQRYSFPSDCPFKIRVSSVGAGTDLDVNVHKLIQ